MGIQLAEREINLRTREFRYAGVQEGRDGNQEMERSVVLKNLVI